MQRSAPAGIGRGDRLARLARRHPVGTDIVVVAALLAATLAAGAGDPRRQGGALTWPAIATATVAYAVLPGRRRRPIAVLAVTALAAAAHMVLTGTHGWVVAAPLVALYHLMDVTADRRRALAPGGLAVLALVALPRLLADRHWIGAEDLAVTAACGLALAAGDATRSRRAHLGAIEERAGRRVVEERLRIARDLHDSMGHRIAVISTQAALAGYVLDSQPDTARQALTHIRQAGRAALDDLRDTIGLLRQADEPGAPTEPAGGIAGLPELVASFRRCGLRVEHGTSGVARPLPAGTDLTVFRVVQESLTNVRKHAGDATARVTVDFGPSSIGVTIEDDGQGPIDPASIEGSGHGIIGMRERVAAVGGSIRAGPRHGGGFAVRAVLPLAATGGGDRRNRLED